MKILGKAIVLLQIWVVICNTSRNCYKSSVFVITKPYGVRVAQAD